MKEEAKKTVKKKVSKKKARKKVQKKNLLKDERKISAQERKWDKEFADNDAMTSDLQVLIDDFSKLHNIKIFATYSNKNFHGGIYTTKTTYLEKIGLENLKR